jgi:hypothetical protein
MSITGKEAVQDHEDASVVMTDKGDASAYHNTNLQAITMRTKSPR